LGLDREIGEGISGAEGKIHKRTVVSSTRPKLKK